MYKLESSERGGWKKYGSVLRWFGHFERKENDMIVKRVCVGSRLLGRPWKRWIDFVDDYLKKNV